MERVCDVCGCACETALERATGMCYSCVTDAVLQERWSELNEREDLENSELAEHYVLTASDHDFLASVGIRG